MIPRELLGKIKDTSLKKTLSSDDIDRGIRDNKRLQRETRLRKEQDSSRSSWMLSHVKELESFRMSRANFLSDDHATYANELESINKDLIQHGHETLKVPEELKCNIMQDIMDKPVSPRLSANIADEEYFICDDRFVFDEYAIFEWFSVGPRQVNPFSNRPLNRADLLLNKEKLDKIRKFMSEARETHQKVLAAHSASSMNKEIQQTVLPFFPALNNPNTYSENSTLERDGPN